MRHPGNLLLATILLSTGSAWAQISSAPNPTAQAADQGFYTDPRSGVTYRKTLRPVEQPVIDQQVTTQQRTVMQPELVTTVRQEQRTLFVPVTRYEWQTKWHGVWNPFSQPSLAYHQVPRTTWEPRVESVQVPVTETKWVQKTETVQIPQNHLRIERRQEVVWEPVNAPASVPNQFRPLGPASPLPSSQIAAAPGFYADTPGRSSMQQGMPATELGGPTNPGIIATAPAATMFR